VIATPKSATAKERTSQFAEECSRWFFAISTTKKPFPTSVAIESNQPVECSTRLPFLNWEYALDYEIMFSFINTLYFLIRFKFIIGLGFIFQKSRTKKVQKVGVQVFEKKVLNKWCVPAKHLLHQKVLNIFSS